MSPDQPIITARLQLRALEADDADGPYSKWVQDPEVTRYLEIRFLKLERDDLRDYIQTMNASSNNVFLGIFLREGDEPVEPIHTEESFDFPDAEFKHLVIRIVQHAEYVVEALEVCSRHEARSSPRQLVWTGV